MPMYEYVCKKCKHRYEKIQHYADNPDKICPICESEVVRLLFGSALHFKGAGWYVNDYASKSK
jgi:putative FmdB family regulatory protein